MPNQYNSHDYQINSIGLLAGEICSSGGIQSFMLRLIEVLNKTIKDKKADNVYCVSFNDDSHQLQQHPTISNNINVWGANHSKIKLIIYSLLKQPSINTLFVGHLALSPLAYIMKLLGRVDNYYVILHGIEAWKQVSFFEKKALMASKSIIATTQFTAKECAEYNHIPINKFTIIPLCADENAITPSFSFKLNGGFKLLCVARQDKTELYKGFETIFNAVKELRLKHPHIHLNVIGSGNDQDRLKTIVNSLGISNHTTFFGRVSNEDLAAAYQDCDVFVMPSKKEGFGIVFLEAMRYAKPCIGGNHGGTPDVIKHGENGFLVEYEDIPNLVKNIQELMDNDLRRHTMGKKGREMLERDFSLEKFLFAYQELMHVSY